jgi:ribonuclease HI
VSNTDNRIVANVLRALITPCISTLLEPSQRAFVRGVSIDQNVEEINQAFYASVEAKEPFHLLLHDFERAYDSISRVYLLALLEHIGLPAWTIHAIRALLSNVIAKPILLEAHDVVIGMGNGLKQGCPLSPILFNLAIDPLLFALANQASPGALPLTQQWGYADDLAVGCRDLGALAVALPCVDHFNLASGSSSSRTKSVLVSTTAVSPESLTQILPPQWHFIAPSPSSSYLGIRIGRHITVADVYAAAVKSLESRVAQYLPLQGLYNLQQRILIANSFLSPILSYLQRFFLMPTTLRAEIQSSLGRWVLKGRLISWDQCCIPPQAGGFALPLRDPFNLNIASLLCRRESPPAGGNSRSMLISAHLARGKAAFLKRCQIDPPTDAPLRDILTLLLKHYKPCYATLAQKYVKNRIDPLTASTWTNNIQENAALLPHHTPRFLRAHLLRVIFNSIPTRQRLRHLPKPPSDLLCRICGTAGETLEHLHTQCRATRLAITAVSGARPDTAGVFAVLRPSDFSLHQPLAPPQVGHIIALSHAVWAAARSCDTGVRVDLRTRDASKSITQTFDNTLKLLSRAPTTRPRKREVERREFLALLSALDPAATHYFTDGSSLGNPGPSGAGVAAFSNNACTFSRCVSLGTASNNVAELEGLSAACDHALHSLPFQGNTPLVFFCDNRYALNMTEGKWKPTSNRHLISTIADKFKLLRLSTPVSLFWVPGHAGIHQNELVDRLAKAGASGHSLQWDGPAPAHILSQGITPPLHPTCPAAPTAPSPASPPASILTEAALSPPRPIRRSSRLHNSKPPPSLFPEVNWFGASPLPPSPARGDRLDSAFLSKLCVHGHVFPSTTLLPLCCVVGDDEINLPDDWSPPLPDYELDPSATPLHRSDPVPALSSPAFLSASLLSATTTRAEPRHLDFEDP